MNSSFLPSAYFWSECDPYNDDGTGTLRGPSAGFLILQITYCFELLAGARQTSGSPVTSSGKDFFPLHLALTQLSFYLALPPFFANHFLWRSNSVLNVVSCLNSMVGVMKPLLLCLVCVERYMAVVLPLHYQRFKVPQYRWGWVGVSWCIYIILSYFAIVERSPVTLSLVFLPVLVIGTFCSLSVLKTLKKPPPGDTGVMEEEKKKKKKGEEEGREPGKQGSGGVKVEDGKKDKSRKNDGVSEEEGKKVGRGEPRRKGVMNSTKKKAFITIAVIQAVLTLNYLPMIVTLPMVGRVPARTLKCQYGAMGFAAANSCSYLQPLLYLHRLGRLPRMMPPNT